ncbi:hypothetical protein G4Y73_06390 [Wenzhouxiangella sp. XN201]|uniref:hypothetical protein n=1 Tax=Wenzhouxiangella sp. XN201 TaxID=2710755 RepID=UPI0013C99FF0|nr:hypothetical protein [Wenzhouxiangella sp. XN201]NEZ03777.1 hypothetical protein [Wenzhouxiangella sp. XN201]
MSNRKEQNAPADQAWQPDELAGFRVGDLVRLPSVAGALEVVGVNLPSTLVLRTPSGQTIKAGYKAVSRASLRQIANRRKNP